MFLHCHDDQTGHILHITRILRRSSGQDAGIFDTVGCLCWHGDGKECRVQSPLAQTKLTFSVDVSHPNIKTSRGRQMHVVGVPEQLPSFAVLVSMIRYNDSTISTTYTFNRSHNLNGAKTYIDALSAVGWRTPQIDGFGSQHL